MNFENLYTYLTSGMTSEDLVAQFTEALNEAEARVAAEKARNRKREDLRAIITSFASWTNTYVDQPWAKEPLTEKEIDALTDALITSLDHTILSFSTGTTKSKRSEDVFEKFFRLNGLI